MPAVHERPRRRRRARVAEVVGVHRLTPQMIRVVLGGPELADLDLGEFTDHYVKLVYPPPGAAYTTPVDVDDVERHHPPEHRPLLRTYTVRAWDETARELTLDFVHHGDEGIAGPWAAAARPGDRISFLGPGGGYAPSDAADWHLLVGDESALPAIAVAVERLPAGVPAVVVVEVQSPEEEQPFASKAELDIRWVHRSADDRAPGAALVDAVRALDPPDDGPVHAIHAFVHGEASAVRSIRRYLRAEVGVDADQLSASGYWRLGRTDEAWRAEKADWKRQVDEDDAALG